MKLQRLIIYFFYDKDGIIDDYVYYMLSDLKKNSEYIFFVSNGNLEAMSKYKLNDYVTQIIERENSGFDAWAYKEALESRTVNELLHSGIDELILMNYTIMGPVYPFEDTFGKMDSKDLDFWGLTAHFKYLEGNPYNSKYGYIPTHIQSHFIAFRKSLFLTVDFIDYWIKLPKIKSYEESVGKHESILTKHFEDLGYNWGLSTDSLDLESIDFHPIISLPTELIRDYGCPIFKRRSFFQEYNHFLAFTNGESSVKLYEYLENNTDYDTELIWTNVLRIHNIYDIKNCLQLNYTISDTEQSYKLKKSYKIVVIVRIDKNPSNDFISKYQILKDENIDFVFILNSEKDEIDINLFVKFKAIFKSRTNDEPFFLQCKEIITNYDLICYIDDTIRNKTEPPLTGISVSYRIYENILKNDTYINNIISLFDKLPRLGLLTPQPAYFGEYYSKVGINEWDGNFNSVKKLAQYIRIHSDITENKHPLISEECFWVRKQALDILYNYSWNDVSELNIKSSLKYIYAFAAQEKGYFTAWLMNENYGRIELTGYNYILRNLNMGLYRKYPVDNFNVLNHYLRNYINKGQLFHRFVLLLKKSLSEKHFNKLKKFYKKFKNRIK